jgi:replicative DNA helicase
MSKATESLKEKRSSRKPESDINTLIYGRVPPQAKEVEEAILGAIMLVATAFETAAELLTEECFYVDSHQRIFRAMKNVASRNDRIDLLTVVQELRNNGDLDLVGGPFYVTKLTNNVISDTNLETHARIVKQKFLAREMIRISGEYIQKGYDESQDVFDVLEGFEKDVMALGTQHVSSPVVSMDEVMMQAIKKIEFWRTLDSTLTGVTSGFKEIDRATRGWQPGDLVILGARPSVGKTAAALNLARNAALCGTPVAMYSLEMLAVSQGLRMLSAESDIWLVQLQSGRLDDQQMHQLFEKGVKPLQNLPIFFEEKTNISISQFRASVRRLYKKKGVRLVIVDYLQLMQADNKKATREQQVSEISREMKTLALELQIPIIALSQMSRDMEKRTNPEPQLSDLRESGAIEQDADLVAFLWAPTEEDVKRDPSLAKVRHFKIAKHRNGVLIKEDLRFLNHVQRFTDKPTDVPTELPEGNWRAVSEQEKLPF